MSPPRVSVPVLARAVVVAAALGAASGCAGHTGTATSAPATGGSAAATSTVTTTAPTPVVTTSHDSPETTGPGVLVTYANARYGFTAQRPAIFSVTRNPTDGDGEGFGGADVSEVVSGENNVRHLTPRQELADDERGLHVTYTDVSGEVVTVSGTTYLASNGATDVVYVRDVVGTGSIDTLRWEYRVGAKAMWDPVVTTVARTFRPGDVSRPH